MSWASGICLICCCSVAKSCLTLRSLGLQHTRLPCPPLSPGVCSHSCPLGPLIICLIMSILYKVIRLQRGYVTCPRSQVRKIVKEPGSLMSARYPRCRLTVPRRVCLVWRCLCKSTLCMCPCACACVCVCTPMCASAYLCLGGFCVTPQHVGHLCVL